MSKLSTPTTLFAMALFSLWALPLMAKTVNCNAPSQDLQKSIDNADIGDKLKVVGTCNKGPFFVQKDLTLVGPATLQAPDGDFATLQILGGTVTLTDLIVDASTNEIGIYVEGATARIFEVHVHNATNEDMRLIGNAHATVFESTFEDSENTGVVITISSSALFFESTIQGNIGFGIQVSQGSSAAFIPGGVGNISQGNGIGVGVEQVSAFQMGGAIVSGNEFDGVLVTHGSFVTMFSANTIQGNGTDVVCRFRGGLRVFIAQNSSTETVAIDDCLVDGVIF